MGTRGVGAPHPIFLGAAPCYRLFYADARYIDDLIALQAEGEPNDFANAEENCVEMDRKTQEWNDKQCSAERWFVCEWKEPGTTASTVASQSSATPVASTTNTASTAAAATTFRASTIDTAAPKVNQQESHISSNASSGGSTGVGADPDGGSAASPGAVVGGVIGGLAALAVLAVAGYAVLTQRRHRRQKETDIRTRQQRSSFANHARSPRPSVNLTPNSMYQAATAESHSPGVALTPNPMYQPATGGGGGSGGGEGDGGGGGGGNSNDGDGDGRTVHNGNFQQQRGAGIESTYATPHSTAEVGVDGNNHYDMPAPGAKRNRVAHQSGTGTAAEGAVVYDASAGNATYSAPAEGSTQAAVAALYSTPNKSHREATPTSTNESSL